MNRYLVIEGEEYRNMSVGFVYADTAEEAEKIYIDQTLENDDMFMEEAYGDDSDILGPRIYDLSPGVGLPRSKRWEVNVYEFFGGRKDWVELFLKNFDDDRKYAVKYPKEMLLYIRHNMGDWRSYTVIPLEEIPTFCNKMTGQVDI